jgi:UDP-N-acetyl-D-galactosamine dehydrogenase
VAAAQRATRVVVVGLGYVGLPLAAGGRFETVGLDIDARRIAELNTGHDRTGEIDRDRWRRARWR